MGNEKEKGRSRIEGERERKEDGVGKSIERGSRTRRFENEGAKVSVVKLCLYREEDRKKRRSRVLETGLSAAEIGKCRLKPTPRCKNDDKIISVDPVTSEPTFRRFIKSPGVNFSFSCVFPISSLLTFPLALLCHL